MRLLAFTASCTTAVVLVVAVFACGDGGAIEDDIVLPDRADAAGDVRADTTVTAPADAGPETAADVAVDTGMCTICERLVFVTSTTYNGNLGGLSGANALCQVRAAASTSAAVRAKTFAAWLGTPTDTALTTHVQGTGLYKRTDGVVVAAGFADLVDGTLAAAISLDELGAPVTGAVWTGVNLNGSSSASTCDGWSSNAAGTIGQRGLVESVTKAWTDDTTGTCDTSSRLYCIER
jgi:hypothetical protein